MKRSLFLILLFELFFAGLSCAAEIYEYSDKEKTHFYEYVDKNGVRNFTDNLWSIPEEYRKNVQIKKKDLKEIRIEATTPVQNSGVSQGKSDVGLDLKGSKNRILKVLAAVIILVAVLIGLTKLGPMMRHKHAASIIRIAISAGVLLYLFITYQRELTDKFFGVQKDLKDVQSELQKRSQEQIQILK